MTVATVTIAAREPGNAALAVDVESVSDEDGNTYEITAIEEVFG